MPRNPKQLWGELIRRNVGKKGFEPKPCHFQMLSLMRCLSKNDGKSESCQLAARAYLGCMKAKGKGGCSKGSRPQQFKHSVQKGKLRKRGWTHGD